MELDNLQLEIGELAPVLSLNFKKFSYRATSYWILTLWRFISDNQFGLCSFANVHLFPLRENDCSIMSCFDNLNIYNKQELKTLNNFRMFLQVTSLADITIGDSKFIREMIRLGRHQVDWKGNLDWGIQCPTRSNFNLWRKAIKNITFGENGRLLQYLGKWINKPSWNEEWRWIPSSKTLAFKVYEIWKIYTPLLSQAGTRSNKFEYQEDVISIPENSEKASVQSLGIDLVLFEGSAKISSYLSPLERTKQGLGSCLTS